MFLLKRIIKAAMAVCTLATETVAFVASRVGNVAIALAGF